MSYLNPSDRGVLVFATNLASILSDTPETFGLTPDDAQAYAVLRNAYATNLAAATEPGTRGPSTVLLKNESKALLVSATRRLAMQINNREATTNPQRQELGLTIRKSRTPVPVPTVKPQLDIVSVDGRLVKIRLREASTGERRKPAGVFAATIMRYIGESIPQSEDQWVLVGTDTRLNTAVEFGNEYPPGTKVWFSAFWLNRRAQSGPACTPVSTQLGFGVATNAGAQDGDEEFKLAA